MENTFTIEGEVEPLVPVSDYYLYVERVGEMEENAKINQDDGNKMLSISILKLNKLHVLLHFSTYKLRGNILRWGIYFTF